MTGGSASSLVLSCRDSTLRSTTPGGQIVGRTGSRDSPADVGEIG